MNKKIAIICGGYSSEFEISLKSANTIHNNLPSVLESYLVVLSREGWHLMKGDAKIDFDLMNFSFLDGVTLVKLDMALVYIHGNPGENGKIQAMLELIGIPYINSGPLASELSFDKWFCNQFLKGFEIPVAKSIYLRKGGQLPSASNVQNKLGLPVFVKPCDSGSSYGIARVNKIEELNRALQAAFEEGDSVVIEEYLEGIEVTCGVYNTNSGMVALPPTEIISHNEFFDFEAKYKGLSDEITPARISLELTIKVQEMAKRIYELMQLRSLVRIDFMIVDDVPNVIEVNTIPGFSNESIVPKMINVAGKTITQVWSDIIEFESP